MRKYLTREDKLWWSGRSHSQTSVLTVSILHFWPLLYHFLPIPSFFFPPGPSSSMPPMGLQSSINSWALSVWPPGSQPCQLPSPCWSFWKRSSSFLIAHQSVWLGSLFLIIVSMCVLLCLFLYIVLFLHSSFSTLFPHWQGPWADDLVGVTHTLTCPHQTVQVTRFGSRHCLLCNLSERFVSLYVIVYGFLLYLFSVITLERSLM